MQSSEEMNMVYKAIKNAFDTRDSQYESRNLNDEFSIRTDASTQQVQITPKDDEKFDKTVVELVIGTLQQFCAVSFWFRTDYDDSKKVVMRIS